MFGWPSDWWRHCTTRSSLSETTALYAFPSSRFQHTTRASRVSGPPARYSRTVCLDGSRNSIEAKRQRSPTSRSRRRMAAACRISSALSGSSGWLSIPCAWSHGRVSWRRQATLREVREMDGFMSRRELLRAGAAGGAALGAAGFAYNSLIERALAQSPGCGSLHDIQHVIILIQENRSFDHYFGSYRGVRGFADPEGPAAERRQRAERLRPAGISRRLPRRPPVPVPSRLLPQRRVHERHRSQLGTAAHLLGRWQARRLREGSPGGRRPGERSADDGLLHAQGPPVLLRAGRRVHDL